jgi:hypothetical protein
MIDSAKLIKELEKEVERAIGERNQTEASYWSLRQRSFENELGSPPTFRQRGAPEYLGDAVTLIKELEEQNRQLTTKIGRDQTFRDDYARRIRQLVGALDQLKQNPNVDQEWLKQVISGRSG